MTMNPEERQLWIAVYSRVLAAMVNAEGPSRNPQYNQDRARDEAIKAVAIFRKVYS